MSTENEQEQEQPSRLQTALLAVATFCAVIIAAEAALRMVIKDAGSPADAGLIHRPQLSEDVSEADSPPFITNENGFYTARPGQPGINADGFLAPEWKSLEDKDKVVLLVGDDATFGVGAEPADQSFAALLQKRSYAVANLGIPGAGVRQYAALIERYAQQLGPVAVVLVFNTADDFELDPPAQPGFRRYYYLNGMPLPAVQPDAQPLTPLESVQRANAAATPPGWLSVKIRGTALGTWLLDTLGQTSDSARVPEVIESLRAARAAAEAAGASFQVVLTPYPVLKGRDPVAAARTLLESFAPLSPEGVSLDDFAEPALGRLNNAGHKKLADTIEAFLASVNTARAPLAGAANAPPPTLDEFCTALNLTGPDRQKAIDFLNSMKEATTAVCFEPAVGAPSPGEFVVGYALTNPNGGPGFSSAYFDYVSRHIHAATGLYYIDLMSETIQQRTSEFSASLPESLRPAFREFQARDLGRIDTGRDPLSERLSASVAEWNKHREAKGTQEISWDEFAAHLALDAEQSAKMRSLVDELKQQFTEVFSKPGANGALSPIQQMAEHVKKGGPKEGLATILDAAGKSIEAESGKTYIARFSEAEQQYLPRLIDALRPEQVGLYPSLPVNSLLKVNTGKDFFSEALERAASGGGATQSDPNNPYAWENFRASLKLDEAQSAQVLAILNTLKDETTAALSVAPPGEKSPIAVMREAIARGDAEPASAMLAQAGKVTDPASGKLALKLMEEAEIKARRAVYTALTPPQVAKYETMHALSLSSIITGYDPMGEALSRK